jgi:hypothetical protein
MNTLTLAILFSAVSLSGFDGSPATLTVFGGINVNGATQPFLFTWNSPLTVPDGQWQRMGSGRIGSCFTALLTRRA